MKKLVLMLLSCVLLTSLVACSSNSTVDYTYADTINWDAEYDVVVAGYGAAGSVSSFTAAENGAKVLLVEKMEEGKEGGNSKVAGQLFAYGNEDEEATRKYYTALCGDKALPDEIMDVVVKNFAHLKGKIQNMFDIPDEDFIDWTPIDPINAMSPEYPWFPGSEKISLVTTHPGISDGYLYGKMQDKVYANSDNIDIWFKSPAKHLIQDPVSKTIIGLQVERDGKLLNIRALNGVILTTGGFECNDEMVKDYLGLGDHAVIGGQYNTGDGIKMAMEVGADLWHMDVYEGGFYNAGMSFDVPKGTPQVNLGIFGGSAITVGAEGKRYFPEEIFAKHGHTPNNGVWTNPDYPERSYVVWDSKYNEQVLKPYGLLPEAFAKDVVVADTIEELAAKIDVNAEGLKTTIKNYGQYAKDGLDPEFGRNPMMMAAFDEVGPYYAIYVKPSILNTQGGPRKNANAEVLDTNGNVIPHLYVAGELGGLTSHHYQGGTNIGECIIFGEIAGKNAAQVKEPLPLYEPLAKVESTPTKPGEVTDYEKFEVELADNELLGIGHGIGGRVYVKVTMDGDTIKAVEVLKHKETAGISDPAINELPGKIVEAQSTEVDTMSGCTVTSKAIIEAVNNALASRK